MELKFNNINNKYRYLFYVLFIFYILTIIFIQYLLPIIITVYNFLILNNHKINKDLYNKFLFIELIGIIIVFYFQNLNIGLSINNLYFGYFCNTLITNSILYYYKDIDKKYKQIIIIKICIFFIVYFFGFISNFNFKFNKNLFLFTNNISNINIKIN